MGRDSARCRRQRRFDGGRDGALVALWTCEPGGRNRHADIERFRLDANDMGDGLAGGAHFVVVPLQEPDLPMATLPHDRLGDRVDDEAPLDVLEQVGGVFHCASHRRSLHVRSPRDRVVSAINRTGCQPEPIPPSFWTSDAAK
jgi:hypothetical protein